MPEIQIGSPSQLGWGWVIAAILLAVAVGGWRSRRLRKRFADSAMWKQLVPPAPPWRSWLRTALACGVLASLIAALVDIRWGEAWQQVPQRGIEIVFALDVSRSMLAEDIVPNRLSRAKQQISDLVSEMAGDRVGLVAFAGEARQVIPMTSHYDDFKLGLESVGPQSVRTGGSRLGDAIEVASEAFLTKTNDHKAMVIFTDGEDQESRPVAAAEAAHQQQGVRIFPIGLGDSEQGSRIPARDRRSARDYVQHNGEQVWSKLNGQILSEIATRTDGAYIPAGTRRVDMAGVYHKFIAAVDPTEFGEARIERYRSRFQIFLAIALGLLLVDIGIAGWPLKERDEQSIMRPRQLEDSPASDADRYEPRGEVA